MDSRLIYSVLNSGKLKIDWQVHAENEWIYIGLGEELNKVLLSQKLEELFNGEDVFIALGRTDSKEIENKDLQSEIINRIGLLDFKICDKKFTKVIEFSKVGVIRIGEKK